MKGKVVGKGGDVRTYDRCCCHRRPPPPARHTCTSRTRSPRRRHRSGFVTGLGSSCSLDHTLGSGTGWGEGLFASRRV